jgi:hypothetical protein
MSDYPRGVIPPELFRVLDGMMARPDMYFKSCGRLDQLASFLHGYEVATIHSGAPFCLGIGGRFSGWLVSVKGFKGGSGVLWTEILRGGFADESSAFFAFLPLYKEYLRDSLPHEFTPT